MWKEMTDETSIWNTSETRSFVKDLNPHSFKYSTVQGKAVTNLKLTLLHFM
jgi:hypothetical protein